MKFLNMNPIIDLSIIHLEKINIPKKKTNRNRLLFYTYIYNKEYSESGNSSFNYFKINF